MPFVERVRLVDPSLAEKVERWSTHLPREEYAKRIRSLIDGCEEVRHWEGSDGDDAARLARMARGHMEDDLIDERR